jgi:putative transposase
MLGGIVHQQMNVVVSAVDLDELRLEVGTDFLKDGTKTQDSISMKDSVATLRHEDQMNVEFTNTMSAVSYFA